MNDFNSTELFGGMNAKEGSGEQENVVASPKSQYGGDGADGDGHEGVVDSQVEAGVAEGSDAGEGGDDSDGADQSRARKQTREDNAAIRAARLRAEHDTAARVAAEADERIARSGILNPATGRPFRSMQELEAFGAAQREAEARRIAMQTGHSIKAVHEAMENRRRMRETEMMQRSIAGKAAKQHDFLMRDMEDFRQRHPDVDIEKLEQNENFRKFCGSRFGMEHLAELYDDYRAIVGSAEQSGRAIVESRSRRSTGSGGGGGDLLDAKQRASLEAWNRANPDMKMSAREFLAK